MANSSVLLCLLSFFVLCSFSVDFNIVGPLLNFLIQENNELKLPKDHGDQVHPASQVELIEKLYEANLHNPPQLKKAQEILTDLQQRSEACFHRVSRDLIPACSGVKSSSKAKMGNSDATSDFLVERLNRVFAVKLTMCELRYAQLPIPASCNKFTSEPKKKATIGRSWFGSADTLGSGEDSYNEPGRIADFEVKSCLQALYDNNRAWTTYMAYIPKVFDVCEACMHKIKAEDTINMVSKLPEGLAFVAEGMHDIHKNIQLTKNFSAAVSEFQKNNLQRLQHHGDVMTALFQEVQNGLNTAIEKIFGTMSSANKDLEIGLSSVNQELGKTAVSAQEVQQSLNDIAEVRIPAMDSNLSTLEQKMDIVHARIYEAELRQAATAEEYADIADRTKAMLRDAFEDLNTILLPIKIASGFFRRARDSVAGLMTIPKLLMACWAAAPFVLLLVAIVYLSKLLIRLPFVAGRGRCDERLPTTAGRDLLTK
ncbi:MAG: hypothetical protein M1820_010460 [Bogoriella megaspora]|nr:MAG: hypothetical protein M1820_010460 [Bogoriella megaspora]